MSWRRYGAYGAEYTRRDVLDAVERAVAGERARTLAASEQAERLAAALCQERRDARRALAAERDRRRDSEVALAELRERLDELARDPERAPDEVAASPLEVSDESEEVARLRAQLVALARDLTNIRRRHVLELDQAQSGERVRVVGEWLAVVDDLDRSLTASDDPESPWARGVELIRRRAAEILERLGVEPVAGAGEAFDPEVHEAVAIAAAGELEDGCVARVERPGYRTDGGRLIRPAQVVVARKQET